MRSRRKRSGVNSVAFAPSTCLTSSHTYPSSSSSTTPSLPTRWMTLATCDRNTKAVLCFKGSIHIACKPYCQDALSQLLVHLTHDIRLFTTAYQLRSAIKLNMNTIFCVKKKNASFKKCHGTPKAQVVSFCRSSR